jgi:protein SCO1
MVVWGGTVRRALGRLARRDGGRVALAGAVTLVLVGLTLTGVRVSSATAAAPSWDAPGALDESVAASVRPRLDQPAPVLELVSHRGGTFSLEDLAGRPALVTFAYGHCATICPLVVRNALEAARSSDRNPAVVVVTLDPWRDTPSRLPGIAEGWELDGDGRWLLGGDPETVEAALDAWNVARDRDLRTGEITHPALTYVLDEEGRIAFASRGATETLVALLERL